MTFLEQYESIIRLSVFAGVFILMAVLEAVLPRKQRVLPRGARWFTNWALVVIDTVTLRIAVPVLAVGMADIAAKQGWGLLALVALPVWAEMVIAVIVLDLLIYAQHVASHKIPILWRFHKVHHVDRDIDVTTGARFHPIEIVLSMGYKLVCVIALGPAALAVFIFELLLNASAVFNHANFRLPAGLDRIMRLGFVTPDVHRVHHSIIREETDSNYGFFLTVWDRLFGTYIAQPDAGHDGMTIGLADYQTKQPASLWWSLLFPFMPRRGEPALGQRPLGSTTGMSE